MDDLERAEGIIEEHPELWTSSGPQSEETVSRAEERLGFKFPSSYRKFLLKYGAGAMGSVEIYGIVKDDFENSSTPDGVWYTLVERKVASLPHNLMVISETGDGELLCLDINRGSVHGEDAPVIGLTPGVGGEGPETIASGFGAFLLRSLESEIQRLASFRGD